MKKSLLILSAASLAASSAMAQTYSAANDKCVKASAGLTVDAAKAAMPLHCRPEVTFYITGATAQAGYMTGTAVPNLFLNAGYFTIREGNGTDANAPATRKGDSSSVGWYGYGNALSGAAGKRIYIAYNPKGSIEGVMQVMSPTAKEPEATWSYPGDDGKCFLSTGTTYFCGAYKATEAGLALSDVKPEEGDLVWMKAQNGGKTLPKYDSSALLSTPVGLQAFGLIVNNNFYKALRDRDIARGYLPASCESEAYSGVATVTSACRPTMARHEYASLIAENGAKDLAFLGIANGASSTLVVNRRYGGSGTQASSNVYFLENPCGGRGFSSATAKPDGLGLNIDKTDKLVSNTYGGGLIPRSGVAQTSAATAAVTGTAYGNISVVEWTSGSDLVGTFGVASATGFHIGVRNVSADDNANWKWIKLDGVDPIGSDTGFKTGATTATGGAAAPFNYNLRTGRYPFAVVFYTVMTQAAARKTTDPVTKMATELNKALATPQVNLSGIASLPANAAGSIEAMRGTLSRPGNNNCAPLRMTGA
jgi:hypothetical protein